MTAEAVGRTDRPGQQHPMNQRAPHAVCDPFLACECMYVNL